jgi:hypothetical protein
MLALLIHNWSKPVEPLTTTRVPTDHQRLRIESEGDSQARKRLLKWLHHPDDD